MLKKQKRFNVIQWFASFTLNGYMKFISYVSVKYSMLIGMGNNPFAKMLNEDKDVIVYKDTLYVYPRFFDAKRLLLKSSMYWKKYLQKVAEVKPEIALYPDYVSVGDFVSRNPPQIKWIYPLHTLSQIDDVLMLAQKYDIIVGYPSGTTDYTLSQFHEITKGLRTWYLGVSTKSELSRVMHGDWYGFDLTTMALGSFKDIRSYPFVKTQVIKIVKRAQMKIEKLI